MATHAGDPSSQSQPPSGGAVEKASNDTDLDDNEHDVDLRAPLYDRDYEVPTADPPRRILHRVVCKMYVASQILQLQTETRFTSIVLFYRYTAAAQGGPQTTTTTTTTTSPQKGKKRAAPVSLDLDEKHLGIVAAACLFLGSKAEEDIRRIRDVINVYHLLDFGNERETTKEEAASHDPPSESPMGKRRKATVAWIHARDEPMELDDGYWAMKERMVHTEHCVLRMLQFNASVSHPYRALVWMFRRFHLVAAAGNNKDEATTSRWQDTLLSIAWKRLNDCLFWPPALKHPIFPMACAALFWAVEEWNETQRQQVSEKSSATVDSSETSSTRTTGAEPSKQPVLHYMQLPSQWWLQFGVSTASMETTKTALQQASHFLQQCDEDEE